VVDLFPDAISELVDKEKLPSWTLGELTSPYAAELSATTAARHSRSDGK